MIDTEAIVQWKDLDNLLGMVKVSNKRDAWKWLGNKEGEFTTIDAGKVVVLGSIEILWRADMDRIPTIDALQKKRCLD